MNNIDTLNSENVTSWLLLVKTPLTFHNIHLMFTNKAPVVIEQCLCKPCSKQRGVATHAQNGAKSLWRPEINPRDRLQVGDHLDRTASQQTTTLV